MSFSELAALTIHDVKNNLAQLAAEAEVRGDLMSLRIALNASETLTRLLCFYKSESQILTVQVEPQNPQEMIDDLLHAMPRSQVENAKIRLETDMSQSPALWFYDRTLIQMVLANALQNALRFAKSKVTLSVIELPNQIEFRVQDDGDGYPSHILETENMQSPVTQGGTGLGLSLAMRVVKLHTNYERSGEIILSNHQGARFSLLLP